MHDITFILFILFIFVLFIILIFFTIIFIFVLFIFNYVQIKHFYDIYFHILLFCNNLSVGLFIGNETIYTEYKEFCINKGYNIEQLVNNYIIDNAQFDNIILSVIKSYFIKYLPKYISSFNNSNFNGKLIIGVSDNGVIHGIPFFGNITKFNIHKYTKKIYKYIKIYNVNKKYNKLLTKKYINTLKIQIIPLYNNLNTDILSLKHTYDQKLKNIKIKNMLLNDQWAKHLKRYKKWTNQLYFFRTSIENYTKSTYLRKCVANFIKKNKYNYDLHSYSLLDKLEKIFLSNDIIHFNYSHDEIQLYKNIIDNPIKWILDYKDFIDKQLNLKKPKRPLKYPEKYYLQKFYNNLSNIDYLLYNNNVNHFLIVVHINIIPNTLIKYRNYNSTSWVYKKRVLDSHNNPCCI
jgi:hypothetical protein